MSTSSSTEGHSTPSEGMECMACMEEIDTEGYVEYRTENGEFGDFWFDRAARISMLKVSLC
jgi:hypothetical protein